MAKEIDQESDDTSAPVPFDEKTARWYVDQYGEHPTNYETVKLASLQPDDYVLDIGCGGGAAVRAAANHVPEGKVVGVDLSPAMVRIAEAQSVKEIASGRVNYLEGEAGKLPLESCSFTVAMAINSTNHWPNLPGGIVEAYRVLAPEGRLLISEEVWEEEGWGTDAAALNEALIQAGFDHIMTDQLQIENGAMTWTRAVKPKMEKSQ